MKLRKYKNLILLISSITLIVGVTIFWYFHSISQSRNPSPIFPEIDFILVEKSKRKLSIFHKNQLIKTYNIALGFNPIGHKVKEGDGKTPEGLYHITYKNYKSKYHLSLRLSYPNQQDIKVAKKLGVSPGGDIMIHGVGGWAGLIGDLVKNDWTLGCIALGDDEITEIYASTKVGTQVKILP